MVEEGRTGRGTDSSHDPSEAVPASCNRCRFPGGGIWSCLFRSTPALITASLERILGVPTATLKITGSWGCFTASAQRVSGGLRNIFPVPVTLRVPTCPRHKFSRMVAVSFRNTCRPFRDDRKASGVPALKFRADSQGHIGFEIPK